MRVSKIFRLQMLLRVCFTALLLQLAIPASAGLILDISPNSLPANAGDLLTFSGRITNTTGVTLNATDMFLNFGGFDPVALTNITQLLGTPDFTLPNNTFSQIVPLFSIDVGLGASAGIYPLAVSLQDINDNISNTVDVTVDVGGASAVPEPASLLLVGIGSLILVASNRRKDRRSSQVKSSLF